MAKHALVKLSCLSVAPLPYCAILALNGMHSILYVKDFFIHEVWNNVGLLAQCPVLTAEFAFSYHCSQPSRIGSSGHYLCLSNPSALQSLLT
jgi:hypothetical protein